MSSPAAAAPGRAPRDASIDVLRGLVMCLMVLDHARDFATSTPFDPTDPDKTTAVLFFTRWVTHFCAPVFVLLAGTGVGITRARGRERAAVSTFLLSRGLWLVVLELTLVRLGWWFDLSYRVAVGQVIWALGWCMVISAAAIWLPDVVLALLGAVLVCGHNLLDPVRAEQLGGWSWLWTIVHQGGPLHPLPDRTLYIAYPLVPWVGVMLLGYLLGKAWSRIDRRTLISGGLALSAAFVALRACSGYGDPHAYVVRPGVRSLFAFLDCEKYPPSLDYLLMTLGPALTLLGLWRGRALDGTVARALEAFGRAPLFFYLLHLPLVHAMTFPFRLARGLPLSSGPFRHGLDLSLPVVYAMWLLALALLWWPTRRWAELKRARGDWWLSYL